MLPALEYKIQRIQIGSLLTLSLLHWTKVGDVTHYISWSTMLKYLLGG